MGQGCKVVGKQKQRFTDLHQLYHKNYITISVPSGFTHFQIANDNSRIRQSKLRRYQQYLKF